MANARVRATAPATTGETVTVACKLPNGLQLRLFEMIEREVPQFGGGTRNERIAQLIADAPVIVLHGNRVPFGQLPRCEMVMGFALTKGVPKDFWEKWLHDNRQSDIVTKGIVMAFDSIDDAKTELKQEGPAIKSGFQAIVPDNDPRLKSLGKHKITSVKAPIEDEHSTDA